MQEVCAFFLSTEAKKDMTALALVPFGGEKHFKLVQNDIL